MSKRKAKQILPFVFLVAIALLAMFVKPTADFVPGANDPQYSSSDIAWVLVSTALVFLMTPCLFLWRYGQPEKCYLHNDKKCGSCRNRWCIMGSMRI